MSKKEMIARNGIYYLEETNTIKPENNVSICELKEFYKEQKLIYAIDIEKIKNVYNSNDARELERHKNEKLNNTMNFQSQLIPKFAPILEELNKEKIQFVIAKGLSYKFYFGWHRPFGDLDLWISNKEQVEKAHDLLLDNGYSCSINNQKLDKKQAKDYLNTLINRSTHLLTYNFEDIYIEIHQPTGNPIDYAKIICDRVAFKNLCFPAKLDMLIIACEHAWQHNYKNFYNLTWITADKIRHYYDVYKTYNKIKEEYTTEQILKRCEELNATGVFLYIMHYASCFFGNFADAAIQVLDYTVYYPNMFPDDMYNEFDYFINREEKARNLLSQQNRLSCLALYSDGVEKEYQYKFNSLKQEKNYFWPCHIYSDLAFDLKDVDVSYLATWNQENFNLYLLLDFKQTEIIKISNNLDQLGVLVSMLFANTQGRTNQIRTEFYKNGNTQTFLYYKEKPQESCKRVKVVYNNEGNQYEIHIQMPWSILDIDNIITYLEPLYFDFVIEFVPKGKEEITQFISWAGGCGCSMWPDYFIRTMSELKLIR